MRHLDDHRRCPHCQRDINERPYLMSRRATEMVLSPRLIAWLIVYALVLTYLTLPK